MARKKISQWHDGDSGVFTDGKRFRLAGVRAAEKNQRGGETATRRAAGMTGRTGGNVNVSVVGRDTYNRQLVKMSNRDGSINKRLIRRGSKNKGR